MDRAGRLASMGYPKRGCGNPSSSRVGRAPSPGLEGGIGPMRVRPRWQAPR